MAKNPVTPAADRSVLAALEQELRRKVEAFDGNPDERPYAEMYLERADALARAQTALQAQEKLRYAVRQCYLLAVREARREQKQDSSRSSRWNHILRFCKDADEDGSLLAASVLRNEQNAKAWEDLRDDGGLPESQPLPSPPPEGPR